MPLQLPNLDDRNYSDLVTEAIAMIPRYAPSWTNYNASDPGITLVELLAYFTEQLIYRLDRVGRENKINFLRLLAGLGTVNDEELKACSLEDIELQIQQAVLGLKQRQRAVTCEDYEYLARAAALRVCGQGQVIRVRCVEGKNLAAVGADRDVNRPGHVSLVVVADRDKIPVSYEQLLREVHNDLEPKRLLTTRLHIVKPCYVWLALSVSIQPRLDASWENVKQSVQAKLNHAFNPVGGGVTDEPGWPFGRNLYLSEIADVLEHVAGVDYIDTIMVRRLSLSEDDLYSGQEAVIGVQIGVSSTVGVDARLGTKFSVVGRLIPDGTGKIAGVMLKPYELLKIVIREQDITKAGTVVNPLTLAGES
jgi:hypothetical protein